MNRIFRAYILGFNAGVKDYKREKNKKFIKIDEKELLSKIYDVGYIDGYKNKSFKKSKSVI